MIHTTRISTTASLESPSMPLQLQISGVFLLGAFPETSPRKTFHGKWDYHRPSFWQFFHIQPTPDNHCHSTTFSLLRIWFPEVVFRGEKVNVPSSKKTKIGLDKESRRWRHKLRRSESSAQLNSP